MTEKQKRREEVLSLLKKGFKPKDIHTMTGYAKPYIYSLSSRYKKQYVLDEEMNVVSKNIKEDKAKESDSYVFKKREEYDTRKHEMYEFYKEISNMLKQPQQIIEKISETYEEVGRLNKEIQHELRILEKCNDDNDLLEVAKRIYCLRNERRIMMIKHKLSTSLKESFNSQKIRYTGLDYVAENLSQSIGESKVYNDDSKRKCYTNNQISTHKTYPTELESPTGQEYLNNDDILDEWKQSLKNIISSN